MKETYHTEVTNNPQHERVWVVSRGCRSGMCSITSVLPLISNSIDSTLL